MPCACAIAPSSGWVMNPAIVCASAPKYAVEMVTTAFCVLGYWLIGSVNTERRPSTMMSRLTTIARTGRRMKRSVNFMGLFFLRRRRRVVGRLDLVVDGDRRAVLELDLAAGDDFIALLDAAEDGDLVPARRAGVDENLLYDRRTGRGRRRPLGLLVGFLGRFGR